MYKIKYVNLKQQTNLHILGLWWNSTIKKAQSHGSELLGRQVQADLCELRGHPGLHTKFQASQGYIVVTSLKVRRAEAGIPFIDTSHFPHSYPRKSKITRQQMNKLGLQGQVAT